MMARQRRDWSTFIAAVFVTLFMLALVSGVFGIRLWIAGGDIGCAFAQDPALCAAVKTVDA